MTETDDNLDAQIRDQLTKVLDPCSCFTDEPVNIIELGLVEEISISDKRVTVKLLLTSPGCTYFPYIARDIEDRIYSIGDIDEVNVMQIKDQIWTQDRMEDEVHNHRRERMRQRMDEHGIEPYIESSN